MGCAPSSSGLEDAKFTSLHGAKVVADDSQEAELAKSSNHAEEEAPAARTILSDTYGRNRSEAAEVINEPGHWDIFISHSQRDGNATTLAVELYFSLKERGLDVWLDVKMNKRDVAAMEEGAKNSTMVIAIVTDGGDNKESAYFRRQFCLQELRWAKSAGVAIQPVIRVDDKKRVGEFIASAPDDLKKLGKVDWVDLNRGDNEYWNVGVNKLVKRLEEARKRANLDPLVELRARDKKTNPASSHFFAQADPQFDIVFSYLASEAKMEARLLKQRLEERGLKVYMRNNSQPGEDIRAVNMHFLAAKLIVIFGSSTYGDPGTTTFGGTNRELDTILDKKIPFFLIKMCDEFERVRTRFLLPDYMIYDFFSEPGDPLSDRLVNKVIERFDSIVAERKGDGEEGSDGNYVHPERHGWTYFLSHKQSDSATEALELTHHLGRDACWLDVHQRDASAKAMENGVRNSQFFVCILSLGYMESKWCMKELEWAFTFSKPIILCYRAADNVGALLQRLPSEFASVSNNPGIKLDRSHPDFFQVAINMIRQRSNLDMA